MFVVLLGAPGAGKGTQAAFITDNSELTHITTGEIFREHIKRGSKLGKMVQPYYDSGNLVPDDLAIEILLSCLGDNISEGNWLLDGFPRDIMQAQALDQALLGHKTSVSKALYIKVSDIELMRRLGNRWSCRVCTAVYNKLAQPPKRESICDLCNGELYQRPDDQPEISKSRLEVFHRQTEPLINYYREAGKLTEVDGEEQVDVVAETIITAVKDI